MRDSQCLAKGVFLRMVLIFKELRLKSACFYQRKLEFYI